MRTQLVGVDKAHLKAIDVSARTAFWLINVQNPTICCVRIRLIYQRRIGGHNSKNINYIITNYNISTMVNKILFLFLCKIKKTKNLRDELISLR